MLQNHSKAFFRSINRTMDHHQLALVLHDMQLHFYPYALGREDIVKVWFGFTPPVALSAFFDDSATHKRALYPRRSGKSIMLVADALVYALHNPGTLQLCLSSSGVQCREFRHKLVMLLHQLQKHGVESHWSKNDHVVIRNASTSSTILMRSVTQGLIDRHDINRILVDDYEILTEIQLDVIRSLDYPTVMVGSYRDSGLVG